MANSGTFLHNLIFFGIALICGIIVIQAVEEQYMLATGRLPVEKQQYQAVGSSVRRSIAPAIPNVELAPDEPQQDNLMHPQTFDFKGYKVHELASFYTRAVLLSKHEYNSGGQDQRNVLSPCDFSIGWGPMSNPEVLHNFTYYQNNRFLYYAPTISFEPEANRVHADWHIANVHLIPADENIANALKNINPRDIVTLEGKLVEVIVQNQVIWKSSLVNTATGDGACKLLFLTHISWVSKPPMTATVPLPQLPANLE